jgi:hypothetical protein
MNWLILPLALGFMSTPGKLITFDSETLGKAPPGWTIAMTNGSGGQAPRWEIRVDRTARTQPYVLAQLSTESGNDRYPLAILDKPTLRDGEVSVRLKPVSGREDRAGGLVWRYRDPLNYYLARANALTKNVAIFKIQNGRRTQIAYSVNHDIPSNDWSILKVSFHGQRFQVYVNHRRLLSAEDRTFSGEGKVGLCTIADSVTYFDDFRVNPK